MRNGSQGGGEDVFVHGSVLRGDTALQAGRLAAIAPSHRSHTCGPLWTHTRGFQDTSTLWTLVDPCGP